MKKVKVTLTDIKAFFSREARVVSAKEMKELSVDDKLELKALLAAELAS